MPDEEIEIDVKIIEIGSDDEATTPGPEAIGCCRVYGDRSEIEHVLRRSEDDCAAYARSHIEEPIEDRKDYKGRVISYSWSPGYYCNGDPIED